MALSQLFTVGKDKEESIYIWKCLWNSLRICLSTGIFLQICFDSFDTFELAEKNHVCKKVPTWYNDFAFHVGNFSAFSMPTWVRKTAILHLFMNALLQLIENVKKWGFIFGHVHYLHQEKKKSQILGPNSKSFQSYGNYKIGLKFQHFTLCHFGFHNCVEFVISPK